MLKQCKAQIKMLLMDQQIIGGIGNAYAHEILYEAGIVPQSIANKIPEKQANKLKGTVNGNRSQRLYQWIRRYTTKQMKERFDLFNHCEALIC
jgi:formamidopyrimidine-DNA glycosylase